MDPRRKDESELFLSLSSSTDVVKVPENMIPIQSLSKIYFFKFHFYFVATFKFRETGFCFIEKLKRICRRSLLLYTNARDEIKKALYFVAFMQIPFHHAYVGMSVK